MQTSLSGQKQHTNTSSQQQLGIVARLRQRSHSFNGLLAHEWGLLTGFVVALFFFLVLFSYDPRDAGFFLLVRGMVSFIIGVMLRGRG